MVGVGSCVQREDSMHLFDSFVMMVRAVVRRDDLFGNRVIEVAAPVGYHAIAGIW
jgi:hypothetical protein